MTSMENVQGHTIVLLRILELADPTAIISCLRASRRFHALAYQHIDILYRHVFIDRHTVESVFQGINWNRLEEQWTVPLRHLYSEDEYNDEYESAYDTGGSRHISSAYADTVPTMETKKTSCQSDSTFGSSDRGIDFDIKGFRQISRRYVENLSDLENSGDDCASERDSCLFEDGSQYGKAEGRSLHEGSTWSGDCSDFEEEEWMSVGSSHVSCCDLEAEVDKAPMLEKRSHSRLSETELEDWSETVSRKRRRWSKDESDPEREFSECSGYASDSDDDSESVATDRSVTSSELGSSTDSEDDSDNEPVSTRCETGVSRSSTTRNPDVDNHRESTPSQVSTPSLFPWDYEYSSDADAQHTRKRHALSKCRILTISDSIHLSDTQTHSHDILHNGKAHTLLAGVTTLRVLPPCGANNNVEGQGIPDTCDQGAHCRFIRELPVTKIVHRNLGHEGDELCWRNPIEELVVFFPFGGWETSIDDREDVSVTFGIERVRRRATTVVFGPHIKRGKRMRRPRRRSDEWRDTPGYRSLEIVVDIIRAASNCEAVTVYGLERVKVWRNDDEDHDQTDMAPKREWRWFDRTHRKGAYGPTELAELVKDHLDPSHESSEQSEYRSAANLKVQYRTLEQYISNTPDDELFGSELEQRPSRFGGKWLYSNYWKSRSLWFKSEPLPELGEGDYHNSDTDEDRVDRSQVRCQSPYDPWKGFTEEEMRQEWNKEDRDYEDWERNHPPPSEAELNRRWRRQHGYEDC